MRCSAGGAGGGTTYTALRKADEAWKRLRTAEVCGVLELIPSMSACTSTFLRLAGLGLLENSGSKVLGCQFSKV